MGGQIVAEPLARCPEHVCVGFVHKGNLSVSLVKGREPWIRRVTALAERVTGGAEVAGGMDSQKRNDVHK